MRTLGILIVLATLALPAAAASPVEDALTQVAGEADALLVTALGVYDETMAQLSPEHEEPSPAPEDEQAPAPEGEPAPEAQEEPARDAPAQDDGLVGSVAAPVTRLVPIPVTDITGPLPRIDVAHIASLVGDAAPIAPAPAPARAPAPTQAMAAPVAPRAASEPGAVGADLVVAGVVATAGAAAAAQQGFAGHVWERLRRFGLLALLYSRIAKEDLLDHSTRERLLATIRARPGLAVSDLAQATGAPRNTVTYHLRVLEREGLASSTRNGRNRLFFAPGSLPQRASADALATLRHSTTLAVAKQVGATPGVDQKAICAALGLSPSLAHWHADRLVASGLIDKRREGRSVRYYPGASYSLVDARAA